MMDEYGSFLPENSRFLFRIPIWVYVLDELDEDYYPGADPGQPGVWGGGFYVL
jgi:hypothetical protein